MKTFKTLGIYGREKTSLLALPRRRLRLGTVLLHSTIISFCLIVLLPIIWMLFTSLKSMPDFYSAGLWPQQIDFSNYRFVFEHLPALNQNLTNTLIVTGFTVVLTTACAVLAGYALVHLRLPGRAALVTIMVTTLFLPARLVALIGIFEINWHLHLLNTLIGLILPYVALNSVVSILIMRGVFQQISPELVDAARIDGSGPWHTLWAVLLPLAKNGIVVVVITNFVFAWGEYLLAMTLSYDQSNWTMLMALVTGLAGISAYGYPQVAAAYLLFILPGIVAFAFLQRWFIKGLIEGALNA